MKGTDEQSYYCSSDVIGDEDDNEPITGTDYANYWTEFSDDDDDGAEFEEDKEYLAAGNAWIFLTNDYSNADGDSAYIEYVAYLQSGVSDKPEYYDAPFVEAFTTLLAAYR